MFSISAAVFKLNQKSIVAVDEIEVSFLLKSEPKKYLSFQTLLTNANEINIYYDQNELTELRKVEWDTQSKSIEEDMKRKQDMKKRNQIKHLTLKFQMEEMEKQDELVGYWISLQGSIDQLIL